RKVVRNRNRLTNVLTDSGWKSADAFVMALGSYSAQFMRKLGRPIPVYPVKGYSITVPITNAEAAPVSTVMDETYKV
ncbi:MAG: FAD-dependent oxidoreductase, partial [Mesorhizobium sp.]